MSQPSVSEHRPFGAHIAFRGWAAALVVALLAVAVVVVQLAFFLLAGAIEGDPFSLTLTPLKLLAANLALGACGLLAVVLVARFARVPWRSVVVLSRSWDGRRARFALLVSFVVVGAMVALVAWVAPASAGWSGFALNGTTIAFVAVALLTTPIQAAGEELLIRGAVLPAVASWFRWVVPAMIIGTAASAIAFAAIHWATDIWLNVHYVILSICTVLMGVVSRGLEAAIAFHIGNNLVTTVVNSAMAGGGGLEIERSAGNAGGPAVLLASAAAVTVLVAVWLRERHVRARSADDGSRRGRRRHLQTGGVVAAGLAVIALVLTFVATTTTDAATRGGAPDVVALAGPLAEQDLAWEECDYSAGPPPAENAGLSNIECATVRVPKDWHDPDPGDTWHVRIAHATNIAADHPDATTLLLHPGGPLSGLSHAASIQHGTPEIRDTTNYVSFEQRGLGQSSTVTCEYSSVPDPTGIADARAAGETCSQRADFATMTTEQVAYDMDLIRHLLGVETVSYFGSSYGTWLGTWYGTLFADHVDRIVLDSPIDASSPTYEKSFGRQFEGIERQFRLYLLPWMARNDATFGMGTDAGTIAERYLAATADAESAEAAGLVWTSTSAVTAFSKPAFYPFAADVVVGIIEDAESGGDATATDRAIRVIGGLDEFTPDAKARAVSVVEAGSAPVEPDPTTGRVTSTFSSSEDVLRCSDGAWTSDPAHWRAEAAAAAEEFPIASHIRRLGPEPMCASWPTDVRMPPVSDEFPETIVIQSELDALTPLEEGAALTAALPDGIRIVVDDEGTHGVFPYGTDAVDEPVLAFLRGDAGPARSFVAPGKPLPLETESFEAWRPLTDADIAQAPAARP